MPGRINVQVAAADLQDSGEEGSGVGEARQPVGHRVALLNPAAQLLQALQQVPRPGAQRLQTRICLQPGWRHLHQPPSVSKHSAGACHAMQMLFACRYGV